MEKKVIVIDNYDSFTYNLVHAVQEILEQEIPVWRNDQVNMDLLGTYEYIILSPGPGIPDEAGQLKEVIATYGSSKKILGVCLGHQAIGEVYGAELINLSTVYHGIQTPMHKTEHDSTILSGISDVFQAGRYHSWVVKKESIPSSFTITCHGEYGQVMGMEHREHQVYGVQFHPESILTPDGNLMITNFLNS